MKHPLLIQGMYTSDLGVYIPDACLSGKEIDLALLHLTSSEDEPAKAPLSVKPGDEWEEQAFIKVTGRATLAYPEGG